MCMSSIARFYKLRVMLRSLAHFACSSIFVSLVPVTGYSSVTPVVEAYNRASR